MFGSLFKILVHRFELSFIIKISAYICITYRSIDRNKADLHLDKALKT